jgi:hypothetical protein
MVYRWSGLQWQNVYTKFHETLLFLLKITGVRMWEEEQSRDLDATANHSFLMKLGRRLQTVPSHLYGYFSEALKPLIPS